MSALRNLLLTRGKFTSYHEKSLPHLRVSHWGNTLSAIHLCIIQADVENLEMSLAHTPSQAVLALLHQEHTGAQPKLSLSYIPVYGRALMMGVLVM